MIATTIPRIFLLVVLLLSASAVYPQAKRHYRSTPRRAFRPAARPLPGAETEAAKSPEDDQQVRLKLIDGTLIPVDEAAETPQGIWYQQRGVTYLVARERVAAIERGSGPRPNGAPQADAMAAAKASGRSPVNRPVWIYLVGGARVEVDSADESSAGVWYRRGSLAAFIERVRIDHLEREETKTLDADSAGNKERGWSTGSGNIDALIKQNGGRYGVDPYLIFCVMEQESHFSPRSISPKGARGLMQLMPGTSARFGVRHPFSPAENISAGTRYLRQLIEQFNGRIDLVLASYNAGEGSVVKYGSRVPPYRETRDYVKRISYRYHRGKTPAVPAARSPARADGSAKTFE
jgi:soluble lytic murein transglycosylase-like protein